MRDAYPILGISNRTPPGADIHRGGPVTPAHTGQRVANLLGALALETARAQEEATRAVVGQTGAAAAALVVVAASPGRTIEQLRGSLGLSQPGAARLFERLASDGWIDRGTSGGRRGLRITLTEAGEQKLREVMQARRTVLLDVLKPLDQTALGHLSILLEQLLAARTTSRAALERLCNLCERGACEHCPVGHALDVILAGEKH
jgi:MarR family transcriptional repressor of emrRAB